MGRGPREPAASRQSMATSLIPSYFSSCSEGALEITNSSNCCHCLCSHRPKEGVGVKRRKQEGIIEELGNTPLKRFHLRTSTWVPIFDGAEGNSLSKGREVKLHFILKTPLCQLVSELPGFLSRKEGLGRKEGLLQLLCLFCHGSFMKPTSYYGTTVFPLW